MRALLAQFGHDHFSFRVFRFLVVASTGRPLAHHRVVKQLTLSVSAKRRGSHMVGTAGQVILNTRESDDHTGRAGLMITCGFEESLDLSKRHTGAWTIYARL
jgi:hypothetical protein